MFLRSFFFDFRKSKMNTVFKKIGFAFATMMLLTQQTVSWAQVANPRGIVVAYSPTGGSTSVPTLSEWAMLGLALLMAAVAVYMLRNKSASKPLASVILVSALALGGLNGSKLMSDASAAGLLSPDCTDYTHCSMTHAGGGTVTTGEYVCGVVTITNATGVSQTVTGLSIVGVATIDTAFGGVLPHCAASLVVPSGSACAVYDSNPC
jgi:hypothetical protein